jgi:hypothetical protein
LGKPGCRAAPDQLNRCQENGNRLADSSACNRNASNSPARRITGECGKLIPKRLFRSVTSRFARTDPAIGDRRILGIRSGSRSFLDDG